MWSKLGAYKVPEKLQTQALIFDGSLPTRVLLSDGLISRTVTGRGRREPRQPDGSVIIFYITFKRHIQDAACPTCIILVFEGHMLRCALYPRAKGWMFHEQMALVQASRQVTVHMRGTAHGPFLTSIASCEQSGEH